MAGGGRLVGQYVGGSGPALCQVMLIGEAPGFYESRYGVPFCERGASGRFLRVLAPKARLPSLSRCYITNLCKQRPIDKNDKDRSPTAFEIRIYERDLLKEIASHDPTYILGLGAASSRWLLGSRWEDMETLHGLPFRVRVAGRVRTIVPCYHPAAGLHNPELAGLAFYDLCRAGQIIRGDDKVSQRQRDDLRPNYGTERTPVAGLVGVDTEGSRWKPWSLQYSNKPGRATLVRGDDRRALKRFGAAMKRSGAKFGLHSSAHDINPLKVLGIDVEECGFEDTAIAAYVLQVEPRGLKPLALRHCGMQMHDYASVTKQHDRRVALEYLYSAADREAEWPPAVGRAHSIARRVESIIISLSTRQRRKTKNAPKGPRARWESIPAKLRKPVEAALGPMPALTLDDCGSEFTDYACRDADATRRLWPKLSPMLDTMRVRRVYELHRDVTPMLARMMEVGIHVNRDKLSAFDRHLRTELAEILAKCRALSERKDFNPQSTHHVGDFLFRKLKISPRQMTDSGLPSTNDQVLKALLSVHPIVYWITEYREVFKLLGFVKRVWIEISKGKGGILYPILRTTNVVTGRLSAEGLNVLALPTHSKRAHMFKDCFEPAPGMVFGACDLDQIEFKIAADESNDEAMLDVFRRGVDLHTTTASTIFKIPYAEVTRTDENKTRYRTPAKITGFRVLYGGGAEGLLQQLESLGITSYGLSECEGFIEGFYGTYRGWAEHIQNVYAECRRTGIVRARGGRMRILPAIWSQDRYLRRKAERDAGNFPIQGGAQWVIQRAMRRLWPRMKELHACGVRADVLLQIHDELLFQAPIEHARYVGSMVQEAMCADSARFKVPITAKVGYGKSWGTLEK